MIKKILRLFVGNKIKSKGHETFFDKLIKEDTNVSMINFFLMATLCVGVILLFVPVVGICVDVWYNHTITINMSDMAVYIGAVAGIFTAGGITSAWTEYSYSKFNVPTITEEDMKNRKEYMDEQITEEDSTENIEN